MFLHKNVGFFSQLPILYFQQVTVIPTISFYQNDPYLNYVVLNINGDTALSGNNNTFLDSGFRGLSSTGNVTQGTFSPFSPAGWSGYFNGSSYLNLTAGGITDFGANPYTFECYLWLGSIGTNQTIYDGRAVNTDTSTSNNFTLSINASAKIELVTNQTNLITTTQGLISGSWNHIAVCRTATTATAASVYINGVGQTFTNAITYVNPRSTIGASGATLGTAPLNNGYISNLRIVKGTALYTTNFTPNSAEPLKLLPNTSLLTLQDNCFKDNSRNNFTLSATGTPQIQPFSPIAPAVDYTPSLHGGSAYFDVAGGYLVVPNNQQLSFESGPFTIEFWWRPASNSVNYDIMGKFGTEWILQYRSSDVGGGRGFRFAFNTNVLVDFSYTGLTINTWSHIALSKDSLNDYRLFVNSIQVGTTIRNATAITKTTTDLWIGRTVGNTDVLNGYISNLRIVKGQAVYTSNFTPPSRLVTATSNGGASVGTTAVPNLSVTPSLLLDFDNGGIIDRSYKNDVLVFGDSKTQTLSSKFGTGSLFFDGTGDYLKVDRYLDLNASQWTIETWFNLVDVAGANPKTLISFQPNTTITILIKSSALSFYIGNGAGSWSAINIISSAILTSNRWHHAALVRNGNQITSYIDGVSAATTTITPAGFNGSVYIGAGYDTSAVEFFNGCIEDIRITKGVARYTGASFTPPSKLQANNSDPYYSNVVLFLDGNNIGSNVNNEFRATAGDAARLAITRTGATQGSFSPYSPNGWSTLFDNVGYFQINSNAAFAFPNGTNFTIECWVNFSSFINNRFYSVGTSTTGGVQGTILTFVNGVPSFGVYATSNTVTSTVALSANNWYHIAVTRSGIVTRIFVNGVQTDINNNDTNSYNQNNLRIGADFSTFRSAGYASNLRVIKGLAVYTSNFTPPTGPLPALSGSGFSTSLLTLQDNRFKDNSPNNFTLSVGAGTPSVQAFNPYKQSTAYSPTLHGGSGYFDGSSYLTVPDNAVFKFGSNNFTVEAWINFANVTGEKVIASKWNAGGSTGTNQWVMWLNGNISKFTFSTDGNAAIEVTGSTILANQWYHIAAVRNGNSFNVYVNGVAGTTVTNSGTLFATETEVLGISYRRDNALASGKVTGYISNLRVVKGRALYTSNFTPPTSPVTAVNGTSLLLNFDNGYAIDSTGNNVITTVGDSRTDVLNTAPLSSSTGSLYFDGTGDYLTIPTNPNLALGSGDFTVEFWVNRLGTGLQHFLDWRTTNTQSDRLVIYYENGNVDIYLAGTPVGITRPLSQNTWNHVALVKKSNITRMFVNGISSATTYTDNNTYVEPTNGLRIGLNFTGSGPLTGYLDDIRITKGVARYTSNFPLQTYKNPTSNLLTYPTDPYRNLVVLDLNADTVNNEQNNTFLDRSGNNLTITRSGSTTQGSFSPFSPAGWSGYFDGSSRITIPNNSSICNLGTQDFTIEAWIYRQTVGINTSIASCYTSWNTTAGNVAYYFYIHPSNVLYFTANNSSQYINGTTILMANVWYHVAVSRQGTTFKMFVNGTLEATWTPASLDINNSADLKIGQNSLNGESFTGYISNLRIVKGQALYTSNFTPLTAALTTTSTVSGVTLSAENVALLTLQDNRFKDNSNNNFTITPNGTPSVKPFSPFQPTATYSPTVHGGSGYFSGSYLEAGISSSLNVNSNYTIETWFYKTGTSANGSSLFLFSNLTTNGTHIYFNTSNELLINNGVAAFTTFTTPIISNNVWYHLAAVRSGTVTTVYLNGVSIGTSTYTPNTTDRVSIGGYADTSYRFVGYLSNLRVVRGVAITPPVGGPKAPVQAVSGTSLLLNFDNAGVVDSTGKNDVTTYSTSKVDYAIEKYGTGALKFNGTTDYMQVGTASDWTFLHSPSAKWTIEFWVYNNSTGLATIFDTANTVSTQAGITINKDTNDKIAVFVLNGAGGSSGGIGFTIESNPISNSALPLSTWTHVAITYDHSLASNNVACYLNGVFSGSASKTVNNPSSVTPANPLSIGCAGNGRVQFFNGAIDELRITNAVRYTGNFSVSSYTLPLSS